MSYEYNSESQQLDFPNPYRIENILWAARATVLVICAIALLALARKHLQAQAWGSFVVPVSLGTLLLLVACWNFIRVAQQLRVFFGRGQPEGLAQELGADEEGSSKQADVLMQTVRQGALEFAIPTGALNGLLYSLVPDLITAPAYVQKVLQNRFSNLAAYAFVLIIMSVAQMFVWGSPVQGWVGAFFLLLVAYMTVRPVAGAGAEAKVSFNLKQVVTLVLLAVLGPAALGLISQRLPDLSWATFGTQAFLILVALTAIEAVFLIAVRKQIDPPPPASKVDTVGTVSFNSDPNLLMQEIDREMQRNWANGIPNRRYARLLPHIALGQRAGNFKGLVIEETQPLAPAAFGRMDWSAVLAYPRFLWLMVINATGVGLTLLGAIALVAFAVLFDPLRAWQPVLGFATLGLALIAVGGYAFRSAHTLWGRFDFESTLTWIEMEGSFIRSKIDLGNRLQDRVFTERDVINVENMTLRVWVTQLRTVVFGHKGESSDTGRMITGMAGSPRQAEYLKNLIGQFADAQSIVVAPGSTEDTRRMAGLGMLNQLGGGLAAQKALAEGALDGARLMAAGVAPNLPDQPIPPPSLDSTGLFCRSCRTSGGLDAAFCDVCGSRLVVATEFDPTGFLSTSGPC